MTPPSTRIEKDSMGEMPVPADALYGASTQRAVLNFPISGYRFGRSFLRAVGLIKLCAARANLELGKLDADRGPAHRAGGRRTHRRTAGRAFPHRHFPDRLGHQHEHERQRGVGEPLLAIAGQPIGSKRPIHPNDHVNMGQSSNDVIPTAIHVAAAETLQNELMPALQELYEALSASRASSGM